MKQIFIKNRIVLLLLLISTICSCEDYLDKSDEMGIQVEEVYSDYYNFKGAVDRAVGLLHNYVYDRFDYGKEIGTFSDECQQADAAMQICTRANTGDWLDWNGPGLRWDLGSEEFKLRHEYREVPAEASAGIRTCNLCIENADLLVDFPEESEYTEEELKNQLLGQAYFLRGWFYFMLIRDFGGMPDLRTAFDANTTNFDVVRPSYQESSAWAVEDLDMAIQLLPENWDKTGSKDYGRVTKTSAKAVKAMIQLYAASPHYNIPREQSLGFSGTPQYNIDKCREALATNIQALEGALSANTRYKMYTGDKYSENFYRKGVNGISDEAIFQPNVSNMSVYTQASNNGVAWYIPHFDGGWKNYIVPTHNATEFYETVDGWELKDADSNGSVWDEADPYNNRDPRLKKNIFCHGDKMLIKKTKTKRGNLPPVFQANQPNGKHYKYETSTIGNYYTGYFYAGKHRWPGNSQSDNVRGYIRYFPFIRFAQLYLDYAELANELYGPSGAVEGAGSVGNLSAVDAINIVRNRIGMPDVHPVYMSSKESFRDYIRMERARELYCEQHRWWDLKRWRIAHEVLSEGIYGAYITEDGNGGYNYGKVKLNCSRVFENKHYWYPFPSSVVNMMAVFEQNPGW